MLNVVTFNILMRIYKQRYMFSSIRTKIHWAYTKIQYTVPMIELFKSETTNSFNKTISILWVHLGS